ncbi:MAG TPA: hypothetical protein VFX01_03640, partial [Methylophilaceae bacterium]|nr:hypothetical protein [Methylophilaceae bacterium]
YSVAVMRQWITKCTSGDLGSVQHKMHFEQFFYPYVISERKLLGRRFIMFVFAAFGIKSKRSG